MTNTNLIITIIATISYLLSYSWLILKKSGSKIDKELVRGINDTFFTESTLLRCLRLDYLVSSRILPIFFWIGVWLIVKSSVFLAETTPWTLQISKFVIMIASIFCILFFRIICEILKIAFAKHRKGLELYDSPNPFTTTERNEWYKEWIK